jgi:8-oxo-dGTP pyrophosphatase MutT (NUDIX family)
MDKILEFGIKRDNEERRDGGCGAVFDVETQKYAVGLEEETNLLILFGGGVDKNEDMETGVLREITEESGLYDFLYTEKISEVVCHYQNGRKNVNRVANATCFLVILKNTKTLPQKLEAHEKFSLVWMTPDEIFLNWRARNENKDYDHWIYFLEKAIARAKELGYDKNSKFSV